MTNTVRRAVASSTQSGSEAILPGNIVIIPLSAQTDHMKYISKLSPCLSFSLSPRACFILYEWTFFLSSDQERFIPCVFPFLALFILTHFSITHFLPRSFIMMKPDLLCTQYGTRNALCNLERHSIFVSSQCWRHCKNITSVLLTTWTRTKSPLVIESTSTVILYRWTNQVFCFLLRH